MLLRVQDQMVQKLENLRAVVIMLPTMESVWGTVRRVLKVARIDFGDELIETCQCFACKLIV